MDEHDNIEQAYPGQRENYWPMLAMGVCFEIGLALAALGLGWLCGPWPWIDKSALAASLSDNWDGLILVVLGCFSALPIVWLLIYVDRRDIPFARNLEAQTRRVLGGFIIEAPMISLLAISIAAGVGEELLFRGWLQRWLEGVLVVFPAANVIALGLASILFGLCHALSWNYAIVAAVMGAYLGLLMSTSQSLLCPIAAHATYDFLAMLWMRRQWSQQHLS